MRQVCPESDEKGTYKPRGSQGGHERTRKKERGGYGGDGRRTGEGKLLLMGRIQFKLCLSLEPIKIKPKNCVVEPIITISGLVRKKTLMKRKKAGNSFD